MCRKLPAFVQTTTKTEYAYHVPVCDKRLTDPATNCEVVSMSCDSQMTKARCITTLGASEESGCTPGFDGSSLGSSNPRRFFCLLGA
jgi:hypothetical protein